MFSSVWLGAPVLPDSAQHGSERRIRVKGTPHHDRSQPATPSGRLDPVRDRPPPALPARRPAAHRSRGRGGERCGRPSRQRRLGGPGRPVHLRDEGPGTRVPRLQPELPAAGRRGRRLGRRSGRRRRGEAADRAARRREGRHGRRLLLADRRADPARGGRPGGADSGPPHRRRDGGEQDPGPHRARVPRHTRPGRGQGRRHSRRAPRDADDHPGGPAAGRDDRSAGDPRPAGHGLRQRGRRPAAAGRGHRRDPRHQRDPARPHRGHRRLGLRPEPHHGHGPRPRDRLRPVHRAPIPRGTGHRRRLLDGRRHHPAHNAAARSSSPPSRSPSPWRP